MTEEGRPSSNSYILTSDGEQSSLRKAAMSRLKCEKPSKKCIYVIVGFALVLLLLCIILGVLLKRTGRGDCPDGVHCDWKAIPSAEFLKDERCDVCTSRSCIKTVEYTLKRIDPSQDPCEDFYQFACGTYIKESGVGVDHLNVDVISTETEIDKDFINDIKDVLDNIPTNTSAKKGAAARFTKNFYDNCLRVKGEGDEKNDFLKELFGLNGRLPWPLVNKSRSSNPKVESILAYLSVVRSNPLFSAELIHAGRSTWIIDLNSARSHSIFHDPDVKDYTTAAYSRMLLHFLNLLDVESKEANRAIRELLQFESKLLKETRDYAMGEHEKKYSCRDMEIRFSSLKWCLFVSNFLPQLGVSGNVPVVFKLGSEDFFHATNRILETTLGQVIVNYANVKFLQRFQQFLPERFNQFYYEFDDIFPKNRIYETATEYWQKCVLLTAEELWLVVHEPYMKRKLDDSKQQKVLEMIQAVNSSMLSSLEGIPHISESNKKILIEEKKMDETKITLDAYVPEQDELDEMFSMMTIEKRPFIEDVLELMKLETKVSFSTKLNPLTFELNWMFLHDPMHFPFYSSEVIGFRYLRFPLLDFNRPKYLDYSTLGPVVASLRWRLDFEKVEESKSTEEVFDLLFKKQFDCIQNQYSQYNTHNVSITDNTISSEINYINALALETSYKAYEENVKEQEMGLPGLPLSNQQLFFLSYAQLQCEYRVKGGNSFYEEKTTPSRVRINGALSQSIEFSKAFRCPPDSPMNPKTKCCLTERVEDKYTCEDEIETVLNS